jgi:hypothetical protein
MALHRDCAWPSPEEDCNRIIFCQEDKMAKIKEFLGLRAGSKAEISNDGQVATIRFSDLEVKVGNSNPALGAIQVESFTLQLSENVTEFPVRMIASGFAFATPGARALLVAHMGDTTSLSSFPPATSDKNFEQEFIQEIKVIVPAGVAVQTTLFLLADHYSGDAYLNILSLDFSLDLGTVDR